MTPYYEQDGITIYHGDCREILPTLDTASIDLVLTDPPYGIGLNTNFARVSRGGGSAGGNDWAKVVGDDVPFDPLPWVIFPKAILWGANHYADMLPSRKGWLIWNKRDMGRSGMHSDAELAWTNFLNVVRCHNQYWQGPYRVGENDGFLHPTQKPKALMRWCIELSGGSQTILDPFMGSGTTLRAAKDLGRKAIGIEIEERYVEIAVKRLQQSVLPLEALA
jgi:site-specific DNA-methyltransferase (adenine-specific)